MFRMMSISRAIIHRLHFSALPMHSAPGQRSADCARTASRAIKKILDIIKKTCYNGNIGHFREDCSDIPDLVPILAVLGAFGDGESVIYNAARLRIKESDRLETTAALINSIGGDVTVTDDGLIIRPVRDMKGGTVNSFGDHRIVMAAAVAASAVSGEVIIKGAEAAEKSYPDFFKDYINLGGKANVIDLE